MINLLDTNPHASPGSHVAFGELKAARIDGALRMRDYGVTGARYGIPL